MTGEPIIRYIGSDNEYTIDRMTESIIWVEPVTPDAEGVLPPEDRYFAKAFVRYMLDEGGIEIEGTIEGVNDE